MKKYIVALLLLLASTAQARDFQLLEVDKVYLDYSHYTWAVDPFLAQRGYTPTNKFDLNLDMDMFNGVMYWKNTIHSQTDETQYRLIGWHYEIGARVGKYADVYFEHFSQHMLDAVPQTANTFDAVGVKIYFYRRDRDSR